jgi:hypothetical protein
MQRRGVGLRGGRGRDTDGGDVGVGLEGHAGDHHVPRAGQGDVRLVALHLQMYVVAMCRSFIFLLVRRT